MKDIKSMTEQEILVERSILKNLTMGHRYSPMYVDQNPVMDGWLRRFKAIDDELILRRGKDPKIIIDTLVEQVRANIEQVRANIERIESRKWDDVSRNNLHLANSQLLDAQRYMMSGK